MADIEWASVPKYSGIVACIVDKSRLVFTAGNGIIVGQERRTIHLSIWFYMPTTCCHHHSMRRTIASFTTSARTSLNRKPRNGRVIEVNWGAQIPKISETSKITAIHVAISSGAQAPTIPGTSEMPAICIAKETPSSLALSPSTWLDWTESFFLFTLWRNTVSIAPKQSDLDALLRFPCWKIVELNRSFFTAETDLTIQRNLRHPHQLLLFE